MVAIWITIIKNSFNNVEDEEYFMSYIKPQDAKTYFTLACM